VVIRDSVVYRDTQDSVVVEILDTLDTQVLSGYRDSLVTAHFRGSAGIRGSQGTLDSQATAGFVVYLATADSRGTLGSQGLPRNNRAIADILVLLVTQDFPPQLQGHQDIQGSAEPTPDLLVTLDSAVCLDIQDIPAAEFQGTQDSLEDQDLVGGQGLVVDLGTLGSVDFADVLATQDSAGTQVYPVEAGTLVSAVPAEAVFLGFLVQLLHRQDLADIAVSVEEVDTLVTQGIQDFVVYQGTRGSVRPVLERLVILDLAERQEAVEQQFRLQELISQLPALQW